MVEEALRIVYSRKCFILSNIDAGGPGSKVHFFITSCADMVMLLLRLIIVYDSMFERMKLSYMTKLANWLIVQLMVSLKHTIGILVPNAGLNFKDRQGNG